MLPLVVTQLRSDLMNYGNAFWMITDTSDEFCIERLDPTKIGGIVNWSAR